MSCVRVPEGEGEVTAALLEWCMQQLAAREGGARGVSALVAAALRS